MRIFRLFLVAIFIAISTAGCGSSSSNSSNQDSPIEPSSPSGSSLEAAPRSGSFGITVNNYDSTKYPEFEIWIEGRGSWFPNLDEGDSLSGLGPFQLGDLVEDSFYVYPFGRSGLEISVPLSLQDDHITNSDKDRVQVWIEEDELYVVGSPIKNFELVVPLVK